MKPTHTVREILQNHWFDYERNHDVSSYVEKEVLKALNCYSPNNGCFVYYCSNCDQFIFQHLGCNSRICSCCGKRYTDQWSHSLSKAMFPVPHRHIVLSVPSALWPYLRDWNMGKHYMDAAICAFNQYFTHKFQREITTGVIVILHPFGKDMKFQPHLHLLITEGGFDKTGKFVPCSYIRVDGFRKMWQYWILTKLQKYGLPHAVAKLMFDKYQNGFYVWLHRRGRITHPRVIAKYVGRYVRHPAIANSRIFYYDGKIVKFFYVDHEDKRIEVTMSVDQFITALIQHIPPPQFKMIRYYGAYARRSKKRYGAKVLSGIKQLNLHNFGLERVKYCPFCRNMIKFVWYCKKPPPEEVQIQRNLTEWLSCNAIEIGHRR